MIAYVTVNQYRYQVAARLYCNFGLVAVYHAPAILNLGQSLNISRNTIVNMEEDLDLDVYCCWVQL